MPAASIEGSRRLARWWSVFIHMSWIWTAVGASATFSSMRLKATPAFAPRLVSSGSPANWCEMPLCSAINAACSAAARARAGSRCRGWRPRTARSWLAAASRYCSARLPESEEAAVLVATEKYRREAVASNAYLEILVRVGRTEATLRLDPKGSCGSRPSPATLWAGTEGRAGFHLLHYSEHASIRRPRETFPEFRLVR